MSSQDVSNNANMKLIMNIIVVVMFAALMVGFINYFMRSEPDIHKALLEGFARQFEQSATNSHWKWQATGRPERIVLIHFNEQGQEKDRRAVRMAHFGWPWVQATSDGCAQLWQTLLNVPARVNGFRVIAEYYPNEEQDKELLGFCRYRLSGGAHFDYNINTGDVIFKG